MSCIIFYGMAEYCNYASKLIIKCRGRQIKVETWGSDTHKTNVTIKTYLTKRMAYRAYKIKVGEAIIGGWKVLNALPQKEKWETKIS